MRLAVVGSPVAHSLSPVIHQAALDACGIEGTYEAIDCDAVEFAVILTSIREGRLDGCNVTMPHKRLAHELVDSRSRLAQRAGAVNTVVRLGHRLVGHNTDIVGIVEASRWAGLPQDGPVLILGAGGAAAAALLAHEGRPISVAARRDTAAQELVNRVDVDARVVAFGEGVADALVVNATPIGMYGESLPEPVMRQAAGLFEMPYASGVTPATDAMQEAGRPVATGEDMLLAQALESFRLWTGRTAPLGVVRQALRAARGA